MQVISKLIYLAEKTYDSHTSTNLRIYLKHSSAMTYFRGQMVSKAGKTKVQNDFLVANRICSENSIMIGDSETDLMAAKYNDMPFIGVSYGYGAYFLFAALT